MKTKKKMMKKNETENRNKKIKKKKKKIMVASLMIYCLLIRALWLVSSSKADLGYLNENDIIFSNNFIVCCIGAYFQLSQDPISS